jgi:hypothetical protein
MNETCNKRGNVVSVDFRPAGATDWEQGAASELARINDELGWLNRDAGVLGSLYGAMRDDLAALDGDFRAAASRPQKPAARRNAPKPSP